MLTNEKAWKARLEYIVRLYDPARRLGADQVENIAAAIATRLSEGVVWKDQGGIAKVHGTWDFNTTRTSLTIFGDADIEDGQLVEVIVKKVEGTKDGS